jgi:hypothetical protein
MLTVELFVDGYSGHLLPRPLLGASERRVVVGRVGGGRRKGTG